MAPTLATKDNNRLRAKKTVTKEKTISKPNQEVPLQFLRIKCPICFENINKERVSSTKCGHVFCTVCLEKALKRISLCPTCRTKLRGRWGHHPLFLDTTNVKDEVSEMELHSEITVEVPLKE